MPRIREEQQQEGAHSSWRNKGWNIFQKTLGLLGDFIIIAIILLLMLLMQVLKGIRKFLRLLGKWLLEFLTVIAMGSSWVAKGVGTIAAGVWCIFNTPALAIAIVLANFLFQLGSICYHNIGPILVELRNKILNLGQQEATILNVFTLKDRFLAAVVRSFVILLMIAMTKPNLLAIDPAEQLVQLRQYFIFENNSDPEMVEGHPSTHRRTSAMASALGQAVSFSDIVPEIAPS